MKYPCKICLVKPACSQECDLYNVFMKKLADLWAPLTIFLSCILLIISCFAIIIHYQTNTQDFLQTYFKWLWWSSMIINLILDRKVFFEHILISVLLAPIMVPPILVWKLQTKLYKRF
jgi:pheromone shutdown protein TraB